MNKILYLLRYLINNKKVKKFITIVLLVLALMSFLEIKSHAATTISDSTYYDGVQATIKDYEALQNDFMLRVLRNIKDNNYIIGSNVNNMLNRMANGGYLTLFYYGDALGTYYQNTFPSPSQKNIVEVIQMDATQVTSNTTNYDWGLNGIQGVRGYVSASNYYEYKFNRTSLTFTNLSSNIARHYMPSYLAGYKSALLTSFLQDFLNGNLSNNADSLINAIENQTTEIQEQGQQITNSINDTNDFLNEDPSNSVDLNINVEPIEVENENTQGISTLVTYFTNKLTNIITNLNDNVQTIEIPIPHSQERIYFQSNMISKYFKTENFSLIYTLLQGGYWVYFGGACIIKIKRIYNWFQDGNALEEGKFTSFMANLRKNNEFFDQFMM